MSKALIIACVQIFTQYSTLKKYLQTCNSLLMTGDGEVPTCFIRCDFNHLMHTFSTWPEIKAMKKKAKNFYLRCLGLVIASQRYRKIKCLLKKICIVALHEEDGVNETTRQDNLCEEAVKSLKQCIAGVSTLDIVEKIIGDNADIQFNHIVTDDTVLQEQFEEECFQLEDQSTFFSEITHIYKECEMEANYKIHPQNCGDHDNFYQCTPLAERILKFCESLPLWSAVMTPFFGCSNITDSSAASEGRFNDLKKRVLNHKILPIRVDEFIETHVMSIIGEQNIVGSKFISQSSASPTNDIGPTCSPPNFTADNVPTELDFSQIITPSNHTTTTIPLDTHVTPTSELPSADEDASLLPETSKSPIIDADTCSLPTIETEEENWKGLNNPKRKQKSNYITPDPSILFVNDKNKVNHRPIGLLKNGNILALRSPLIDEQRCIFTNTCAFDSVFTLLCAGYVESSAYLKFIEENISTPLFKMVQKTVNGKITSNTYHTRGSLLLKSELGIHNINERRLPSDGVIRNTWGE